MQSGNLLGEPFDGFVLKQIDKRQKIHYSGVEVNRTPEEINYLNNRNAWVKLASGVNVSGSFGDSRLRAIGFNESELPNFRGTKLAKNSILFNGMASLQDNGSYAFREGIRTTSTQVEEKEYLWTTKTAYGLGSNSFGQQPMPGIIDVNIQAVNRGSIRKAVITLKAHNKFQFELIELLYLRLGYSMLIEWGWDKYVHNETGKIEKMGHTLSEDYWFNSSDLSQSKVLKEIENQRIKYSGNYDGFFGKVSNFEWNLGNDGVYNITLHLITVGDVIESLKANKPLKHFINKIVENEPNNDLKTSNIVKYANDNIISNWLYKKIQKWDASTNSDFYKIDSSLPEKTHLSYYIRLGRLLLEMEDQIIENVISGDNSEKILDIDLDVDNNLIYCKKYQFSTEPKICIMNVDGIIPLPEDASLSYSTTPNYFTNYNKILPQFFDSTSGDGYVGKLMNLYMNFDFIVKILYDSKDTEGNISLYRFLEELCKGINSSFCNTTKLEPILKDDRVVTLIDQNSIPQVFEKPGDDGVILYGYDSNRKMSNFIRNINFNTKLSPKTASMISIGATSGKSSSTILDGTLFSKWNIGLEDRFKTSITENPTKEEEDPNKIRLEEWEYKINLAWKNAIIVPLTHGRNLKKNPILDGKEYPKVKKYEFIKEAMKDLTNAYQWALKVEQYRANENLEETYIKHSQELFGIKVNESTYFGFDDQTLNKTKSLFIKYVNYVANKNFNAISESSNTIGFIPLVLSLDLEGLAGVKIYQRLNLIQEMLPYQYNDSFQFLITQVNHKIENNDWVTSLATITNSNLQNLQTLKEIINTPSTPSKSNKQYYEGSQILSSSETIGFLKDILIGIGIPNPNTYQMDFIKAWNQAESSRAAWNPLNTTWKKDNSPIYNSHNVRNYPNRQTGLNATISTLLSSRYYDVVTNIKKIKDKDSANQAMSSVNNSQWGTRFNPPNISSYKNPDIALFKDPIIEK